jgi:uncharacterized protein (DUF488 family)
MTTLFTIGFTGTTAENFFRRLADAKVRKVIDTRLWPDTQLSGFAKRKDLGYFLKNLVGIDYEYNGLLAPDERLLKDAKAKRIDWPAYERRYLDLLQSRHIAAKLSPQAVDHAAFLCAEAKPDQCHRRLLVEYLQKSWSEHRIIIKHL